MTRRGGRTPARGPHFFLSPEDIDGDRAVLRGPEAHHLRTVLRAREGQPVSLADGTLRLYQARVRRVGPEVVLGVEAVFDAPRSTPHLTVIHALPRARKLDEVVQRLSEVGVDRLVPVHSERSQVQLEGERATRAVRRWRAVALAAAKQSRRSRVLAVDRVGEWAAAFPAGVGGVVLWEEATPRLRDVLAGVAAAPELVLGVGPEGGLTEEEVATTRLPAVSLGPAILRTETAALVAASATLTLTGRLA